MRFSLVIVLLAVSLMACSNREASNQSWEENQAGQDFAPSNLTETRADKAKQDDPYNTNQNPSFLDLSPNQPTLGTDVDKARDVVRRFSPYEAGSVWINGNRMKVTVYEPSNKNYSNKEEETLYKKLVLALPRYDIRLHVKEK